MADFPKPPKLDKVWASLGDKTPAPDDSKIATGFIVEIPLIEQFNYIDWKQDAALAHLNQRGIPEWDSITEYTAFKSYVQGSNGVVYKALTTHTNVNPTTEVTGLIWRKAFYDTSEVYNVSEASGLFTVKFANLSDLTNISDARTNLQVYSKTETNNLYPLKTANLFDLNNTTTAFNNIKQAATESYAGVSRLATDVEAIAGTDNTIAITPKKLKLGFSFNVTFMDGSIHFPSWMGGFIFKWYKATSLNNIVHTGLISFPTAAIWAIAQDCSPTDNNASFSPTKAWVSGVNVVVRPTGVHDNLIFALGY